MRPFVDVPSGILIMSGSLLVLGVFFVLHKLITITQTLNALRAVQQILCFSPVSLHQGLQVLGLRYDS